MTIKNSVSAEMSRLYDQLLATNTAVERKGKTTPYTSVNGHMTSFLSKEETMGLRLSLEDRTDFMTKYGAKLMVQHGREMKAFVSVSKTLLADLTIMAPFFQKSIDYTMSLKPK